jgi:hypothetical protein
MRGWMSCAMDAVVYSEYCGDGCNKVLTVSLVRNGRGMQSPASYRTFFSAAVAQVVASSLTRDWGGKFLME